jgi:Neprosin
MHFNQYRAVLLGAFGAAMSFGAAVAQEQASTPAFAPFSNFVSELRATTATKMTAQPFAAVKTPVEAEQMRQHLLGLYDGVSVKHSYALSGQTFDCMPINQQPSVRQLGIKTIAAPPPKAPALSTPAASSSSLGAVEASQQSPAAVDAFGNTQRCEAGSFPMRRITLPEISRFKTLQEFFQKGPTGAGQAPQKRGDAAAPPSINGHSYAHEYQYVNNYGGYSVFSLFRPYVTTSWNEVFSLSQQWYVGGSGSALQTAEIGIQNFPAKYGSENSALFIYWTADDYNKTGCYNHDCAAFVQVNNNWHLGGGFNNYSTVGGAQYEVALGFYLYNGNWWMAAGNDWVGYYPGSIYNGGQLSRFAQEIDFGGETVGSTIWPPMGSGQYASAGWTRAAYHRSILYRNAGNSGFSPSLTVSQQWPSCQTASPATWGGATWQTYFFFGGPGGYNC